MTSLIPAQTLIEFRSVSKAFAGIQALSDVSLNVTEGECLGLMGENGAGKSTLGKILAGVHRADSGVVVLGGVIRHFASPAAALRAGIGMVHQELAFCPDLSVAENLGMASYPKRWGVFVDRAAMARRAREMLGRIGVELDVSLPHRALTTAQEQLVQIASAVGTGAKVIVFDEPTSSLSEPEARRLFELVDRLKSAGVTQLYVSHRMREIVRLCDRVAILRDGKYIGAVERQDITEDRVVRMMVGRSVATYVPSYLAQRTIDPIEQPPRLEVNRLSSPGKIQDVSFSVRAGEIVGFAGLVGSGRSEVAKAIFGLDRAASGSVRVSGKLLAFGDVRGAQAAGVALLPEDRKKQGLVLGMSCRKNISLAGLNSHFGRWGILRFDRERLASKRYFGELSIKAASDDVAVSTLSGGNQQKVALAKWLALETGGKALKVLIVDEPTRGVDVAAKAAIHEILDRLAREGLAILLISSEMPELLALSARVLVLREGRLVSELTREDANEESVLRFMTGVNAA